MPEDSPPPLSPEPSPAVSPARVRALRWLVRLRAVMFVAALIAIVVYVSNGLRPVRLAVFVVYGLLAATYAGVYLYARATRRPSP